MTTSESTGREGKDPGPPPRQAFVWVWLPGATTPVVAGRLDVRATRSGGLLNDAVSIVTFTYGASYLRRVDAIALYTPELPLHAGRHEPRPGLEIAGCIRDSGPDSWGQRVILARKTGARGPGADTGDLDHLTYLLESGTNRTGGLDFQVSATDYTPRTQTASLEQLMVAAEALEEGAPLPADLVEALQNGTTLGGAHPKATIEDNGKHLIAKFSRPGDTHPWIKAEAIGMELGRRVGLDVPDSDVVRVAGRDVLVMERFDRTKVTGERKLMISALTILGLHELLGHYATYPDLGTRIRAEFADPEDALRDLFARIVFNICIGNTDDHARNHAAFWDGRHLRLTPAYDLTPQPRSTQTANQAMAIGSTTGAKASQLQVCRDAAVDYNLSVAEANEIIDHTVTTIDNQWEDAADAVTLTLLERETLRGRQILNPYIFYT